MSQIIPFPVPMKGRSSAGFDRAQVFTLETKMGTRRIVVFALDPSIKLNQLEQLSATHPEFTVGVRWSSDHEAVIEDHVLDLRERFIPVALSISNEQLHDLLEELSSRVTSTTMWSPLARTAAACGMLHVDGGRFGGSMTAARSDFAHWELAAERLKLSTIIGTPSTIEQLPVCLVEQPGVIRVCADSLDQLDRFDWAAYGLESFEPVLTISGSPNAATAAISELQHHGIPSCWLLVRPSRFRPVSHDRLIELLSAALDPSLASRPAGSPTAGLSKLELPESR